MKLLKLKYFSKKLLANLLTLMILLPANAGCSWLKGKEVIIYRDTLCSEHLYLKDSKDIDTDMGKISVDLFEYIKVNETTAICKCKNTIEERNKCYQQFLDLENA